MVADSQISVQVQDPPGSGEIVLEVRNLWKIFGRSAKEVLESDLKIASKEEILEQAGCVLALRNLSFSVTKGEFFVIMGLSGSGKSTLIRSLIRLIEPSSGEIEVNGENIRTYGKDRLLDFRRHVVAMVFQNFGLLPHYRVIENAAYGLRIRGEAKTVRLEKAKQALETVGLAGWEDYYPDALSGGMQQRVGIARALATEPEILLMDEPFSGLDPLIRREMQDELVVLQDTLKKTIIFVTHDLHEALKLGDRIAIMRDGELIQIGTPEAVITSPADDYVRQFVKDASPAKVLTVAGLIQEPELLLYQWEGPKTARKLLRDSGKEWAFVVTKRKEYLGLVTLDDLDAHLKAGGTSFGDIIRKDIPTARPEMMIEELFPLASATPYPIVATNEDGRFLGEISKRMIFDAMTQEEKHDE